MILSNKTWKDVSSTFLLFVADSWIGLINTTQRSWPKRWYGHEPNPHIWVGVGITIIPDIIEGIEGIGEVGDKVSTDVLPYPF